MNVPLLHVGRADDADIVEEVKTACRVILPPYDPLSCFDDVERMEAPRSICLAAGDAHYDDHFAAERSCAATDSFEGGLCLARRTCFWY